MRITHKDVQAELAYYKGLLLLAKAELNYRVQVKDLVGTDVYLPPRRGNTPFANVATEDLLEYGKWVDEIVTHADAMLEDKPPKAVAEVLAYAEHFFSPGAVSNYSGSLSDLPTAESFAREVVAGQFRQVAQQRALAVLKPKLFWMKVKYYGYRVAAIGLGFGIGVALYRLLK